MRLEEIENGSDLILTIKGKSKLEMPLELIRKDKGCLIVASIKVGDKVLNFNCDNPEISMFITMICDNSPPIMWHSLKICNEKLNGNVVHRITATSYGVPLNRRQEFRVFTGINCSVKHDKTKKPIECILKDISYNGVGVVAKSDLGLHIGDKINIIFTDSETKSMFSLNGNVVRQTQKNGKYLIGCLVATSQSYRNYVQKKQVLILKKQAKNNIRG